MEFDAAVNEEVPAADAEDTPVADAEAAAEETGTANIELDDVPDMEEPAAEQGAAVEEEVVTDSPVDEEIIIDKDPAVEVDAETAPDESMDFYATENIPADETRDLADDTFIPPASGAPTTADDPSVQAQLFTSHMFDPTPAAPDFDPMLTEATFSAGEPITAIPLSSIPSATAIITSPQQSVQGSPADDQNLATGSSNKSSSKANSEEAASNAGSKSPSTPIAENSAESDDGLNIMEIIADSTADRLKSKRKANVDLAGPSRKRSRLFHSAGPTLQVTAPSLADESSPAGPATTQAPAPATLSSLTAEVDSLKTKLSSLERLVTYRSEVVQLGFNSIREHFSMMMNLQKQDMFVRLRQAAERGGLRGATTADDWEALQLAHDAAEESVKEAEEAKLKALQEEREAKAQAAFYSEEFKIAQADSNEAKAVIKVLNEELEQIRAENEKLRKQVMERRQLYSDLGLNAEDDEPTSSSKSPSL